MKETLCPKCGKKLTIDTHRQLLSSPPQYPIWCSYCGNYSDGIDCEEYLKLEGEIRKMNKSTITMDTKKVRGFEFISTEQQLLDFKNDINIMQLKLPKRGTSKSAGYDIFAPYYIKLQPNEEINIPTGLKAYMQDGEVLMAFPRSGLGFKYYCRLANTVGVIDGDYYNNPNNEGHMFVKIRNEGTKELIINQGDGMCQMIFMPFLLVDGDSFDEGEERKGGFGSTTGGNK
jgi:dUTP pyrophosphatase